MTIFESSSSVVVQSGTYAPVLTPTLNVAAAVAGAPFMWSRVGNIVTVTGRAQITPTAPGLTGTGISRPIASNTTGIETVGVANGVDNVTAARVVGQVTDDAVNDRADVNFTAVAANLHNVDIVFQYRIV